MDISSDLQTRIENADSHVKQLISELQADLFHLRKQNALLESKNFHLNLRIKELEVTSTQLLLDARFSKMSRYELSQFIQKRLMAMAKPPGFIPSGK